MDPRSFSDKQFMLEELKLDYLYKFGEYSEDGVNLSVIDWFLEMTPIQRLQFVENHAEALDYYQGINR